MSILEPLLSTTQAAPGEATRHWLMNHVPPLANMDAASTMKEVLQNALDELVSTRTSATRVSEALTNLDRLLAEICTQNSPEAAERLYVFTSLQDTFECNVPSRILAWMSLASSRLDYLTSKASDQERKAEISTLSAQLIQALSLIQGVALMHKASKHFLGRRYALEVLLDLLLTSRHVLPMPLTATSKPVSAPTSPKSGDSISRSKNTSPSSISLASAVLDTLLCVLVDSSPALRMFEESNGVQLVVRILKRAGTPREVRMKCLEFLYFYLLDETTSISSSNTGMKMSPSSPSDHFTPSHRSTLSASTDTSTDSSGSGYSSMFSSASSSSATSIGSTQLTPTSSSEFTSTDSDPCISPSAGYSTPLRATGLSPSPRIITPPGQRAQPRSLLMLRKEVDYIPLSPKKAPVSRVAVGGPRAASVLREKLKERGSSSLTEDGEKTPQMRRSSVASHVRGYSMSSQSEASSVLSSPEADGHKTPLGTRHRRAQSSIDLASMCTPLQLGRASQSTINLRIITESKKSRERTMEEKKEILGSMLGNVDALVEGVRKAGIWGLG